MRIKGRGYYFQGKTDNGLSTEIKFFDGEDREDLMQQAKEKEEEIGKPLVVLFTGGEALIDKRGNM